MGWCLRATRRLTRLLIRIILYPAAITLESFGFCFLRVPCVDRIGHLALDVDSYLKENVLCNRHVRPIYLSGESGSSRSGTPANFTLMQYWGQYLRRVPAGSLQRFLAIVRDYAGPVDDLADYAFNITTSARAYEIQSKWNGRPPLLSLTEMHRERGREALRGMGLPDDAWFVCLHAREGGYSPVDEHHHSYRNVEISTYDRAIEDIVARGGWCIRMGDTSMRPMKEAPGVVDYALSEFRSDWLDIFLCASCRFFLGNNSGLFNVAGVFGRMSVLTNTVPIVCGYSPFPSDLSIPKDMILNGKRMTVRQCFSPEVGQFRLTPDFESAGISFVDNTTEQISALVREAFGRLDGTVTYTLEDELLQECMRDLIRPGQYCWQASSRIGRDYLRSRAHELLDS